MNYRKYASRNNVSYKPNVNINTCCEVCGVRVTTYFVGSGAKRESRTAEGTVNADGSRIRCPSHP